MRALILAGGIGKRLWPLSSDETPKQFLSFGEGVSLLQKTVRRFHAMEHLIVTHKRYTELVAEETKGAVLVEPESKSTAPAILLGVKHFIEKEGVSENEVCVVCPSDHYFETEEDFLRLLPSAERGALRGEIVMFGVKPSYPETGYGYIKAEEGKGVLRVERFVEKPSADQATRLIKQGGYYWNMGIFVFQIKTLLKEIRKVSPELFKWFQLSYSEALLGFSALPSISIDHAVMEKTDRMLLIPYPSLWSDLGSWDRLSSNLPKDESGNVSCGDNRLIETEDTLIFGEGITAYGVRGLVIVKRGDEVVVCSKERLDELPTLRDSLRKELC